MESVKTETQLKEKKNFKVGIGISFFILLGVFILLVAGPSLCIVYSIGFLSKLGLAKILVSGGFTNWKVVSIVSTIGGIVVSFFTYYLILILFIKWDLFYKSELEELEVKIVKIDQHQNKNETQLKITNNNTKSKYKLLSKFILLVLGILIFICIGYEIFNFIKGKPSFCMYGLKYLFMYWYSLVKWNFTSTTPEVVVPVKSKKEELVINVNDDFNDDFPEIPDVLAPIYPEVEVKTLLERMSSGFMLPCSFNINNCINFGFIKFKRMETRTRREIYEANKAIYEANKAKRRDRRTRRIIYEARGLGYYRAKNKESRVENKTNKDLEGVENKTQTVYVDVDPSWVTEWVNEKEDIIVENKEADSEKSSEESKEEVHYPFLGLKKYIKNILTEPILTETEAETREFKKIQKVLFIFKKNFKKRIYNYDLFNIITQSEVTKKYKNLK